MEKQRMQNIVIRGEHLILYWY